MSRPTSAPSVSRPPCAGLFIRLHVVCPLPFQPSGRDEIAPEDSLLVLVNGHLEAVEAFQADALGWIRDPHRLPYHVPDLGVSEQDFSDTGPSYILAVVYCQSQCYLGPSVGFEGWFGTLDDH